MKPSGPSRYWMATSTIPCVGMLDMTVPAPLPATFAPPWIQTITGSGASGFRSGVRTSRYRQSSDVLAAASLFQPWSGCGQAGTDCVASRTPGQDATGCGGFHRNGPTGGSA